MHARPTKFQDVASSWLVYLNCMMMHEPANVKPRARVRIVDK